MRRVCVAALLLPFTACGPVALPTASPPPITPAIAAAPTTTPKADRVKRSGMKIDELYGEAMNAKDRRKWDMDDSGVLTVTLPPADYPVGPGSAHAFPPLIGKKLTGDFTMTARLSVSVPKEAPANRTLNTGGGPLAYDSVVGVGVSVVSAVKTTWSLRGGVVLKKGGGEWTGKWSAYEYTGGTNAIEKPCTMMPTGAVYVRLTRAGTRVTFETSNDGQKWQKHSTWVLPADAGDLVVGPTAFACLDKDCSVTFDEYQIKPLTEEKK